MEDAKFFYYSNLAKYSITNNSILIILIIIEMYPILIDFIEAPIVLRNYYNYINESYIANNVYYKPIIPFKKINLYRLFRTLRNKKKLYPFYIVIPTLGFVILYIIFFIVFSIIDKKHKDKGISSKNRFGIYFKIFFVNLYDHIIFRTVSIYIYDVIICYLNFSKNYILMIFSLIFLSIVLYVNVEYFKTFRLIIKYDLNYKYIYDGKFMFYADYLSLLLKLAVCFQHNVKSDPIVSFFIVFQLIVIIFSVLKFLTSNCFNLVNCFKGLIFIYLLLLFLLNFIFPLIMKKNRLYYLYLFLNFLLSLSIVFIARYYKILKVIRAPVISENNSLTQEKFELLCEYYQLPSFDDLLSKICFAMKIKIYDEKAPLLIHNNGKIEKIGSKGIRDNNILLHHFLTFISNKFKEDSKNVLLDEEINLFYYIICKIYLELMTNQQNNFYLLFETRTILMKLKKNNIILYFDLKFFYDLLCEEYAFQNNVNFLAYNDAFYKVFQAINFFLHKFQVFISKRNYKRIKNYIKFAKISNLFCDKMTANYDILSSSSYKDEYQKVLLRIIIEGIYNNGITKDHNSLLINEELSIYDEMLDKQYHTDQHLKILVKLNNIESKIIKIGRELNFLWNKNIESMFPYQFIHFGKNQFYYDFKTQEKNFGGQMFKFFILEGTQNIKQFVYVYKIYPKIKKDIVYLDGYYQLGSDSLLVTELDTLTRQENLILTSKSLQSLIYINQLFIDILEKYQININLNTFIYHVKSNIFHLNAFIQYINYLIDKITNICVNDELAPLKSVINDIKKLSKKNLYGVTYQLINIFSLTDNEYAFKKEYKIYTLKKVSDKKPEKDLTLTKFEFGEDEDFELISVQNDLTSVINAFDINSVSSIQTDIDSAGLFLSYKKKIKSNKKQNNNGEITIIFNLLVILVAFFALIYENHLNDILLDKTSFYKTVTSFNILILNTMVGYYSLLCYAKKNGENCVHEFKEYLNEIGFSEIYDFNQYEHKLKVISLTELYKKLKGEAEKSNNNEIKMFLNFEKKEIHYAFVNNSLKNDRGTLQDFDYLMVSFINKLVISTNSEDFQTVEIYPLIVNEYFEPIYILNKDNSVYLGTTQIYIYEIMTSYLDYSNHFYNFQKTIEKQLNQQIKRNKNILVVFIIALIFANILIMGICFYFLRHFKIIVNGKLQNIEILLKNENNINTINNKLSNLSTLSKLYKQNPLRLLNKLSELSKLQNKKEENNPLQNNQHNNQENDYEIQEIKNKIYDLTFLINPFIYILIILIIIYTIYSTIFLLVSYRSFNQINTVYKIIEMSSYSCLQFYLELGIIELYQFIKIPENSLYNTLWALYDNKTNDISQNAFVDLLNIIQESSQNENSYKDLKSSIGNTNSIISLNCSTLYSELNDNRFNKIFNEHNEVNYNQIINNYCNTISSLTYQTEHVFIEDLTYIMMKLLLINSNNQNYIPNYIPSELYSVIIKTLVLYRPLKNFLEDYYFEILNKQTKSHFYVLTGFLLGNIFLEIFYFFIIKNKIIDKIEKINKNIEKLLKMLKCVN